MSFIQDVFSGVEKLLLGAVGSAVESALHIKVDKKHYQPGDVELIDITLMSSDQQRKYSLMEICKGIDLYESVLSPVMFCELVISDSAGVLQSFPILGGEYISVSFRTPRNKTAPITFLFTVNSIENKRVNEANKNLTYTLVCVSAELLRNSKKHISMKITDNINNIIQNIFNTDLGSQKPLELEPTDGIHEIRFTRLTPLQAIDYLRQRASSKRYQSGSFCFFENRKGFHFASLERMLYEGAEKAKAGGTDKAFFFDTSRHESIENVTARNIIAYNRLQFGDALTQIQSGGLNNQVQGFDLITGNVKKTTYTDNLGADKFKSSSSTSSSAKTTSFVREHGKTTIVKKVITTRSDKPEVDIAEKMTKVTAFAQKVAQNITQIHIYGDSDINVGDVIECRFPSGVDAKKGEGVSRLDSGNYLVTKVRHIILNTDRPQYTQALELIKTDLQEVV